MRSTIDVECWHYGYTRGVVPVMPPVELLLSKLPDAKKVGKCWSARCPTHNDRRASLSITDGTDGKALVKCHAGCDTSAVLAAIGLQLPDLFPKDGTVTKHKSKAPNPTYKTANEAIKALEAKLGKYLVIWTYHDINGEPVGMVVRWDRPDGKVIRPVSLHPDGWRIGAMPSPRPMYQLPEVAKANSVIVTEGEKPAEAARSIGFIATTSAGGAQAAEKTDWRPLAGKQIIILPDNDEPGRKYAETVASILATLEPPCVVRILEIPDLLKKGDVVDWIEAHGDTAEPQAMREEIEALAHDVEPWQPHTGNKTTQPKIEIISASSLMAMQFPEPKWAVEGILPEGATILASKPKQGKSWMALNIALAVADGGTALGKIATEAGDVLYLALEDGPRRLQGRLKMMLPAGQRAPLRLHLCTKWPGLEEGATDALGRWLDGHSDARLIVVDTLARIRGCANRREDLYARDYETIGKLKAVADAYSVANLIIHHERKSESEDPFDSVSGTLGLTGAADAVLVLKRQRGTFNGILHITGRDFEERELALQFDPQYGLWQLQGDAATVLQSRERQSIIDLLTKSGPKRPVEIADLLNEKQPTIRSRLMRMADVGLVKKTGNTYDLSDKTN